MVVLSIGSGLFCFCCVFILADVAAQQNIAPGEQTRSPVTLTSISVITEARYGTSITINYQAVSPVKVTWIVDEGFSPTALDPNVQVTGTRTNASLVLPTSFQFTDLHVQFLCIRELFELHLDLDKSQFVNGTFPIKQYDFYVPPRNEIGISSRGESQFHVFVNLTGTSFSFGMIAAEVSGKTRGRKGDQLLTHMAFSFLPDNRDDKLRLREIYSTRYEAHYDVIVKDQEIYNHGGILSLLAACPVSNSVIRRMDMKQTIHLHPKSQPVLPLYFMALADLGVERKLTVDETGKAFLRCKTIGNPTPSLTLVKRADILNEDIEVHVPSYDITLPFEVTKIFQFINVTNVDFGQYVCKADNGRQMKYREYILSGLYL